MNLNETVEDLRSLMAPLDPAGPDRVTGEQLLATAPSPRHIMALGEGGTDTENASSTRSRRPWTRRRVLRWSTPGILIALAAGAIAAADALGSSPASIQGEVRCYSLQQLTDDPHRYTDTSEASSAGRAPAPDESATVTRALDACSALWQIGLIQSGRVVTDAATSPGDHPVPALAACVLPSGEAAVFPGDATTCARLDLRTLADRK